MVGVLKTSVEPPPVPTYRRSLAASMEVTLLSRAGERGGWGGGGGGGGALL